MATRDRECGTKDVRSRARSRAVVGAALALTAAAFTGLVRGESAAEPGKSVEARAADKTVAIGREKAAGNGAGKAVGGSPGDKGAKVSHGREEKKATANPYVIRVKLADREAPAEAILIHRGHLWPGSEMPHWDEDRSRQRDYDPKTGLVTFRGGEMGNAKILWRFRHKGYKDAIVPAPENATASQTVDAILQPTKLIKGRVAAAESCQPLDGVTVALLDKADRLRLDYYVNFNEHRRGIDAFTGVRDVTRKDGSFELPSLDDAGEKELLLIKGGDSFAHLGKASDFAGMDPLVLPLPRGGAIEGVMTIAGKPAAGERVSIAWIPPVGANETHEFPFGVGGQTTLDADGRFRYSGLGPGRYRFQRIKYFSEAGESGISMPLSGMEELVVLPGETVVKKIELPAGPTITGKTVDASGKPLAGCIVTLESAGAAFERLDATMSDANGRFQFLHAPKGKHTVAAELRSRGGAAIARLVNGSGGRGSSSVDIQKDIDVTVTLIGPSQGTISAPTIKGSIPPDFTATVFDGSRPISLSELYGKVVAIDFWATWCGPCMAVMPEMKQIHEKHKDGKEVVFLTVSLDHDEETLRAVMKEKGLEFPVIFSGDAWSDPIARSFGVRAIPSSFVIGRDGRFAAERVHGRLLAMTIDEALRQPVDPALGDKKPARLIAKLQVDGEAGGIPGAKIVFRVLDRAGKLVREESSTLPGQASQLTWLYPPLEEGGKVVVTASIEGLADQSQTLVSPAMSAETTLKFATVRRLTGRIVADDGAPLEGMEISARRMDGLTQVGKTDGQGRFALGVLPGAYYIIATASKDAAPMPSMRREQVIVAADNDPAPVSLDVCRIGTAKGTVVDAKGQPVAGAIVQCQATKEKGVTDAAGRFELRVPSKGRVLVSASNKNLSGSIALDDGLKEEARITLWERGSPRGRPTVGQKLSVVSLTSFKDGSTVEWKPASGEKTLVAICPLWHPKAADFLTKADAWASAAGVRLTLVSTDWKAEQARREAARLSLKTPVTFVDPGGLTLAAQWKCLTSPQAILLSPKGEILAFPPTGKMHELSANGLTAR